METEVLDNSRRREWGNVRRVEGFEIMKQLKVRQGVKKALDVLKDHKRETYDDVITKLIIENGMLKKNIPLHILKTLDQRIENVNRAKAYSVEDAKKKVFSNEAEI